MKLVFRAFEEVFPIFLFLKNKNNILNRISDSTEVSEKSKRYEELGPDSLNIRIREEHERATKIDEKTFKFTLGLSVSLTVLTVLAVASGSFFKFLPNNSYSVYISIICGVASIYMLAAGITALGAIKTLDTYGYGTDHLLNKKYGTDHLLNQKKAGDSYLAEALYKQERMNIIRQMRNEVAYQFLRNGFLMLFLALSISVVMLITPTIASKPSGTDVVEISNNQDIESLSKKSLVSDEKNDNK